MNTTGSGAEESAKRRLGIADFKLLSSDGVVGRFEECELLHVFLVDGEKKIHHYFAIVSFEEFLDPEARVERLTSKLISVEARFSLGVIRKRISIAAAQELFLQLCENRFVLDGADVVIPTDLQLLPKTHVPSLWGTGAPPVSGVLKPNNWGDRYILEFVAKTNPFDKLLRPESSLQINKCIKSLIPIDLESVYDRIGSFIFQFPITVVRGHSGITKDWTSASVHLEIDQEVIESQDICGSITTRFDDTVTGHATWEGCEVPEELALGDSNNLELKVYNPKNGLVYHNSMGNFFRTFNFSVGLGVQNSEPRIFVDSSGTTHRIGLVSYQLGAHTGTPKEYDSRTRRRILQNEILSRSGRFVSIRKGERDKAINFLREQLAAKEGSALEVWLWDPFLRYQDIFDVLYFVANSDVRMKCILSFTRQKSKMTGNYSNFRQAQRQGFISESNNIGIKLEVRACHDSKGFDFHDRFLFVLPRDPEEIPTVFSLGTSVNGFGNSHHLIQQTLDPRNIVETFSELWDQLDDDDSTIISLPRDKP